MSLAEYGDPVLNSECPKCHHYPVVYNGNYFCENYAQCGWAMSEAREGEEGRRNTAIVTQYLKQRRIQALVKGNAKEAERMEHYLQEVATEL